MWTLRTPAAPELLLAWERGLLQQPAQRALTLLQTAAPGATVEALAQLSIGQRNHLLLALRELAFGSSCAALSTCPACGQRLDLDFAVADVRARSPAAGPEPGTDQANSTTLQVDGYAVRFRLPTSLDLLAVAGLAEAPAARQQLLARCLIQADRDGEALAVEQLPAAVVDAISLAMDRLDPQANPQLSLACPACAHRWLAALDPGDYLWREVEDWAVRTLRDVHTLAWAYGWSEAEILAMNPARRQIYLELLSS